MPHAPERTWQAALGELFTERRKKLGLPHYKVAARANQHGVDISPDVVGRIMRGDYVRPSLPELAAIAHALDIKEDEWIKVALSSHLGWFAEPVSEWADDLRFRPVGTGVKSPLAAAA